MTSNGVLVRRCKTCGKKLWKPEDKYRTFNDGKIIRCEKCCKKMGIQDYSWVQGMPKIGGGG